VSLQHQEVQAEEVLPQITAQTGQAKPELLAKGSQAGQAQMLALGIKVLAVAVREVQVRRLLAKPLL
jgi:hypothetical protein